MVNIIFSFADLARKAWPTLFRRLFWLALEELGHYSQLFDVRCRNLK